MDERLKAAMSFATPGGYAVDVGTDHGYLACGLVQEGFSRRALATDLREGPLSAARKTVEKKGLSDLVALALTDGLTGLELEDITDIFICGMGGLLIAEILEKRHPLSQNLILQPMTRAEELREWLCGKGYRILAEKAAEENGKVYTIINCRYDGVFRECPPLYALLGEIPGDLSQAAERYRKVQLDRLEKKARGLLTSGRENDELQKISVLIQQIKEMGL